MTEHSRKQMEERRTRNYRGVIPNTFTMGNVVCGFLAILSTVEGQATTACWFIVLAGFLDLLDGKIARFSGGTSDFGVELDSLADFLSFGIAPALLVHTLVLERMGKWFWIVSIIFIMAAAYRLARYNLMADTEEKKDFLGLPVPAAAFGIVSFVIFSYRIWHSLQYSEVLVTMIILFAFLMVSHVEYETVPDRFDTPKGRVRLAILVFAGILLLFNPRLLLFPLLSLYILWGMIKEFFKLTSRGVGKVTGRVTGRSREEEQELHDE